MNTEIKLLRLECKQELHEILTIALRIYRRKPTEELELRIREIRKFYDSL